MKEIVLSIVLPVYNVEQFLPQCVCSVCAGTDAESVEILLVDDGSTDRSGELCDDHAERFPNCRVFHKENGGLSDARNYGLRRAQGKYVFFLDSDDAVRPEHLRKAVDFLRTYQGDILLWDAELVDEQGKCLAHPQQSYYSHGGLDSDSVCSGKEAILRQLEDHNDYVTTVWLGAYRREMLLQNNLWFEKGLLHEDELWTPKVLLAAQTLRYYPFPLYQYRVRQNSIMTGGKRDRSRNLDAMTYIFACLQAYYDWAVPEWYAREKLQADLTKRYLHKISCYNGCRYPTVRRKIPKWRIVRTARGAKDRLRAIILLMSGRLYCAVTRFQREA